MSAVLNADERLALIDTYEAGIEVLEAAFNSAPADALHFHPAPGEWSNQQVVCHCADTEMLGAVRARMIAAENGAVVVSIDQDVWAGAFSYELLSAESALALVRATRTHTAAMLRLLPDHVWSHVGQHTESGPFPIIEWLAYYSEHLHVHANQIEENVKQFELQS